MTTSPRSGRALRIATILAGPLQAGLADLAVRTALEMDGAVYHHTVIAGEAVDARGLEVVRVPALRGRPYRRALRRALQDGNYDVAHSYGPGVGVRAAAIRAGIPRIVHTWNGPYWRRHASWPVVLRERRLAARTDAYLAVGTETAAQALRLGLAPAAKVRVVWPGVDVTAVPSGLAARAEGRALLGLPLGALIVAAAGRDESMLVRVLGRLPPEVHGLWIGPSGRRARTVAARQGVADRLQSVGSEQDMTRLLPSLDAFVQLDRCGAIPALMVEAVAAGVPLVAVATPCLQDLVRPGETGFLVAPGDPGGLADALTHLLENPAEGRRMARSAGEWLDDRCAPERLTAVLAATYRFGK
jgi:glycosyltransferase involved in cell wall biosynthesis